jgi:Na+/citrate or Na+/malate symporter
LRCAFIFLQFYILTLIAGFAILSIFYGHLINQATQRVIDISMGVLAGALSPQVIASIAVSKETKEVNTIECQGGDK